MTKEQIFDKVQYILADKLGFDKVDVKPESHLANDLKADSLDEVEIIMECEKEFGISIPDYKVEGKVFTVQDVVNVVEEIVNR